MSRKWRGRQVLDNMWFAAFGYLTFVHFGSGWWNPWALTGAYLGLCVGLLWGIRSRQETAS